MHGIRFESRKLSAKCLIRHVQPVSWQADPLAYRLLFPPILRQELHVSTNDVEFSIQERDPPQDDFEWQETQYVDQKHMMLILLALAIVGQYRIDQLILFLRDA